MTTLPPSDADALELARLTLYRFFASATGDPLSARWDPMFAPEFRQAAAAAAELVMAEASETEGLALAPGELAPSRLGLEGNGRPLALLEGASREAILEEHELVFGLTLSKECPAHEAEYCPQTFSVYRSQRMADIAGFYRAFGLEPSTKEPERADHVSLELEFMAWLIGKERFAREQGDPDAEDHALLCREAAKRFDEEHLAWWLPAFAHALWRKAEGLPGESFDDAEVRPATFFGSLARSLAAFVAAERAFLDIAPPSELAAPNPADIEEPGESSCADCALTELA